MTINTKYLKVLQVIIPRGIVLSMCTLRIEKLKSVGLVYIFSALAWWTWIAYYEVSHVFLKIITAKFWKYVNIFVSGAFALQAPFINRYYGKAHEIL